MLSWAKLLPRRVRSEDGSPRGDPVGITLKVAGVHWWYRTRAHAAELTAGYFNAGERDGYREIIDLCARYHATFTLTCVEMCDAQHPPEALCSPEGLLRQVGRRPHRPESLPLTSFLSTGSVRCSHAYPS